GLVVAVLTGLSAVTWQWRAAVAARDEARQTLRIANEAVETYFTQVSEEQLLNEPGMQPLRERLLKRALPYYKAFVAQKGDDPMLRSALANAYLRWGTIASDLGSDEADGALESAIRDFEGLIRSDPGNVESLIGRAKARQALAQHRIFSQQHESGRREA